MGIRKIISDAYQALEKFFHAVNGQKKLLAMDKFIDLLRNLGRKISSIGRFYSF